MKRLVLTLACIALAAACSGRGPEMRVIGVHDAAPHEVVFVQVTNPANHSMRLTKLEYTFAADDGKQFATGEVDLSREVPAGSAVIVEVPLDGEAPAGPLTLTGELTAERDEIVRTFPVSASVTASTPTQ